jgi:hypothetical protein
VQIGAVAANPATDTVTYKINALGQRVLKTAAGAQAVDSHVKLTPDLQGILTPLVGA